MWPVAARNAIHWSCDVGICANSQGIHLSVLYSRWQCSLIVQLFVCAPHSRTRFVTSMLRNANFTNHFRSERRRFVQPP